MQQSIPVSLPSLILIDVEQLAKVLHKSVSSIRSDNTRNPELLPPRVKIRGNKRLLWRLQDVEAWLARHVEVADGEAPASRPPQVARTTKRGRPTKAEQIHRARELPTTVRQSEGQRQHSRGHATRET